MKQPTRCARDMPPSAPAGRAVPHRGYSATRFARIRSSMDRAGNQPLPSTRRKVRSLGLFLTLSRLAFPTMTNSSLARVIATLNPKVSTAVRSRLHARFESYTLCHLPFRLVEQPHVGVFITLQESLPTSHTADNGNAKLATLIRLACQRSHNP